MKIIVGLGNPGLRYKNTRHNAGFMVLDVLAKRHRLRFRITAHNSRCAEGRIKGEEVLLMKPQTYMNLSGRAVVSVRDLIGDLNTELLTVTDDIDLPVGKIRLRTGGSAGGHKGIRSISEKVGTDFSRLKLGVCSGEIYDASKYVLSGFARKDKDVLRTMLLEAADCAESWLTEGPEAAMNAYNGT